MFFLIRRPVFVGCVLALVATHLAHAQNTRSWTGLAAPSNSWTNIGNWNTGVPVSADTALFNGSGNANTSISLGAATQPINTIRFDGAIATSYNVGVLGSGDKFNFDAGGAIVVANNISVLQTINAAIQTNGNLTVTNSGTVGLTLAGDIAMGNSGALNVNDAVANTTTFLGGNISQAAGQPSSLGLFASNTSAAGTNFIINGTNTYTGPTTIQVYTGAGGSIQIGSNSPFGTGTVSVSLVGNLAPQFSANGSTRTVGNAFNVLSGLNFTGSNSFAFMGPFTIINPIAGGARTLTNSITTAGKTVTLGASPGSSTITLGNPVANGGDGVGKTLIFSPVAGATTIINDIMQDPTGGEGGAAGSVQYAGSVGGVSQINSLSTYTGSTVLGGSSTVKIGSDYNIGGTSGPFGLGTITTNNSVTNNILEPIAGNRTVANAVSLANGGLTFANDTGDTSSLTLAGPISMPTSNNRFITNNFAAAGGTLTLGSAASPSTITLQTVAGQTLTFAGTGTTIINDVIQNSAPANTTTLSYTTIGPVALNAQNTYTGATQIQGTSPSISTIFRIGASSNGLPGASFTAGPFGTGTVTMNATFAPTLKPIGADRAISNAITMTTGFFVADGTASEDPTGNHNMALNGPITLGGTPRNLTNNLAGGTALTLGSAAAPSTLSLGSTLTIQTQTAGGGSTIINDAVTGVGGLTVQSAANVQLNGASSYGGTTTVTGTGSKLFVNGSKSGTGATTVSSGATLGGNGTIAGDIANSGTIAPGNNFGTLTTTGNVTMSPSSHLAIELNGTTADKLAVGGNLDLSNVESLDVTGAGQGLSWVIASYTGTLTGTFNNITAGYTVTYGPATNGTITLNKAPSGVNGDFNNDGKVDAADYITYRKNNNGNTALPNDNGLGTPIGPNHYTLWRSNFGKPPGSGSEIVGGSVPEPTSLLLILMSVAGCSAVRGRR